MSAAPPAHASNTGGAGSDDPLRLVICPACGYSLEGLPAEGLCPECGGRYDQSAVILHGWARGAHAGIHNGPPWIFAAAVFWPLLLLWNARKYLGRGELPIFELFFAALWIAAIAWLLWSRWTSPALGLVRVRLDSAGCHQLDNTDTRYTPPATPWKLIGDVLLKPTSKGRYRLRLRTPRRRWWESDTEAVDTEVQLTPEQAEVLRQWIDTCMRQGS